MADKILMGAALSDLGRGTEPWVKAGDSPSRAMLAELCAALSEDTGIAITSYAAPNYARLLTRLKAGEVQLAWLPPVVALRALRFGAKPLAVPVRADTPWFWAALFTRSDSAIRELDDLRDARAVWVDPESASGYLMIRAALSAKGYDPSELFIEESFVRTHDAVVREVMSAKRTVGAGYMHLDSRGDLRRASWGDADVRILERAGPIASDLIASSGPASLGDAVRAALTSPSPRLKTAAEALFSAHSFNAVDRSHLSHLEVFERYLVRSIAWRDGSRLR